MKLSTDSALCIVKKQPVVGSLVSNIKPVSPTSANTFCDVSSPARGHLASSNSSRKALPYIIASLRGAISILTRHGVPSRRIASVCARLSLGIERGRVLRKTKANCGSEVRAGQGRILRPLPVRAVARNCSFRFEKSFMRFKPSLSETTARRGRSTLSSLIIPSLFIIPPSFFLGFEVCQWLTFSQSSRVPEGRNVYGRHHISPLRGSLRADSNE